MKHNTQKKRRILCTKPWTSLMITVDGKVSFCCYMRDPEYILGDLQKSDLNAVWNGQKAQIIRKTMLQNELPECCRNCPRYNERAAELK